MTEPVYHKQPHTQDPTKDEIPEDAPLAQGHSRDEAELVAEAAAEHKQTVEDEREAVAAADEAGEPAPGAPRAPGDHAGEESQTSRTSETDGDGPPDGSIDDVLAWVGDDQARAQKALDAENARSSPRSSLVSKLESITA